MRKSFENEIRNNLGMQMLKLKSQSNEYGEVFPENKPIVAWSD